MTQKPNAPEFSIYIRGIDYSDAFTLCGTRWAAAASTWCDEDGDDQGESRGNIGISLAKFSDLIDVCREIANASDWTDISDWDVALHVNRMAPNYNIIGHLAESGASLVLQPHKPANAADDEALTRLERTIADARAAACLMEEPTP